MNYNAFISYRHSDLDMFVAKQVHKRLETFKVPRKVQKETGIKKIERVFRDQEELPIGSNLSDNISEALRNSEYLIVICSPRTPESYWVQTEIKTFFEMHDRDHVLAVLIEGEPEDSFPEALRFDEQGNPVEPLAADVRGATQSEMKKKMPTEFMRLAAPLLHCTYDDLRQRHKERQMHRMMAIMGGVMALGIAFGGYYAYTASQIQKNYQDKQVNQSKYLSDTALDLIEDGDRITAIQLSLEALPYEEERPYVPQAEYALTQSLNVYTDGSELGVERTLPTDMPVSDFNYSADGKHLVVTDNGSKAYVYRIEDGDLLLTVDDPINETCEPIDLKNAYMTEKSQVILGYEDHVECLDLEGKQVWNIDLADYTDYVAFNAFYYDKNVHLGVTMSIDCIVVFDDDGKIVMTAAKEDAEAMSFTAQSAVFSPDGKKLAIPRSISIDEENDVPGTVTVFDLATGEATDVHCSYGFVARLLFIDENRLAVVSDHEKVDNRLMLDGSGKIEGLDVTTGAIDWSVDYEFSPLTINGSSSQLFYSDFTGRDGVQYQLLNYYGNNEFISVDVTTGQEWFRCNKSSSITGHHYANDYMVILFERGGYMDIISLDDRQENSDNTKDTKLTITKARAGGGVITVKQYQSPGLVLLSYPKDPNMEEFCTTDASVSTAMFTDDSKYVVVKSGSSGESAFFVYDFQTKAVIDTIPCESYDEVVVGHNHDLFVQQKGGKDTLVKYEITDDGCKEVASMEIRAGNDDPFDLANDCFLVYGGSGFQLIDLNTMEVRYQDDQLRIYQAAVGGSDCNLIAFVSEDNVIHLKNGKTNSESVIHEDSMKALLGMTRTGGMALSPNGKYIALNCIDYTVRIYDVEQEQVVYEIPFGGRGFSFLQFTPDSTKLLMQGDDYYLQVYDLNKGAKIQANSVRAYHISQVDYLEDEDGNLAKVALHCGSTMCLLNADTFDLTAAITNGCDISLKNDIILCAKYKSVVSFPYYSLEELYEIAREQTGGKKLTEEQRVQLNVD